jgi:hypothetical protein
VHTGRGPEKLCDLDNHELLPTQALRQAKTLFSLVDGLAPIFRPFRGGLQPEKEQLMRQLAYCLPALPGLAGPKTYAAWPVWSDSTRKEVRFQPMPQKKAVKLFHLARRFDRSTHQPGKHGGAVGHSALQVLHALIFDCLDYKTGVLDPSYAKIARNANVCVRTVATALKRLRELGILHWVRRCAESWQDGRFVLEQETNAYAVLPATQWRGYTAPQEPPAPWPDAWGATPPLPSQLDLAAEEMRQGAGMLTAIGILGCDPPDSVAAALAQLARTMIGRDS